jgi:peptidoglycan hydrolase CwlO-like protein
LFIRSPVTFFRRAFMQTRLPYTPSGRTRGLSLAVALLVAVFAIGLATWARPAGATPSVGQTQAKIDSINGSVDELKAQIAEDNRNIDSLIGQLSGLRARASELEAQLAAKQAELDKVEADLKREREHLADVRSRLQRALKILRDQLVSLYMSGTPDVSEMVLASADWSDLVSSTGYAEAIQNRNESVIERVEALRNQIKDMVEKMKVEQQKLQVARDEIAAETEKAEQARDAVEAQKAEFESSSASRQARIDALEAKAGKLEDSLPDLTNDPASSSAPVATPPVSGSVAVINSDGTASAPADAPQAVKDVIAAGNAIIDLPYVWGGGHGSFESSGYDCSGTVSYALHGAGLISSPLDSTGLTTWGEPGEGNWITVYGNSGHAFMHVAGISLDTSGTDGSGPSWSSDLGWEDTSLFVARHPSGL